MNASAWACRNSKVQLGHVCGMELYVCGLCVTYSKLWGKMLKDSRNRGGFSKMLRKDTRMGRKLCFALRSFIVSARCKQGLPRWECLSTNNSQSQVLKSNSYVDRRQGESPPFESRATQFSTENKRNAALWSRKRGVWSPQAGD